jgi:hypothetical protein
VKRRRTVADDSGSFAFSRATRIRGNMKSQSQPWHLLLILAGWINRHQQDAIDFLHTQNHILREKSQPALNP